MAMHLGVEETDDQELKAMAISMIEAVNLGTEAAWRALMHDRDGMEEALRRLRENLEVLDAETQ